MNKFHIKNLNLIELLEDLEQSYQIEGKNTSPGWIEVNCPFCTYPRDPSKHMGINSVYGTINCWICGTSGTILKYVMKIKHVSQSEAQKIVSNFSTIACQDSILPPTVEDQPFSQPYTYPLMDLHKNYLLSRYFNPEEIQQKYNIRSFGPAGKYKLRIYIPIIFRGKEVAFTTRDVTEEQEPKYLNCPKTVGNVKNYLYNLDTVKDIAIIVEGPTDVWRIGDGAVATMGIKHTLKQIFELKIRRAFILFDSGTNPMSLANNLKLFVRDVEILDIPVGDPAELSGSDVKSLRQEIFTKIY